MEVESGRVVFPAVRSHEALASLPAWARPLLEASIQLHT